MVAAAGVASETPHAALSKSYRSARCSQLGYSGFRPGKTMRSPSISCGQCRGIGPSCSSSTSRRCLQIDDTSQVPPRHYEEVTGRHGDLLGNVAAGSLPSITSSQGGADRPRTRSRMRGCALDVVRGTLTRVH